MTPVNYPVWQLAMGGGPLVALVAVTHVFVSHFAVGGGLFLVFAERRARASGDAALLAWVRRHSAFFAKLTLVFGALTGVGIWFTIGLVHPAATSALLHTFLWVWAIEWVFFAVEIAASLLYAASWDRVDAGTHLAIGWVYFVAAFLSLFAVNGILAFMFTPGEWLRTHALADAFWNPTFWPSLVVRSLTAVAFAGLYVFATAWRAEPALRPRLARLGAWWALPATAAGPAAAWFWFERAPGGTSIVDGGAADRVVAAVHALRMSVAAALLYALLLALVAWLAPRRPRIVSLPVGLALLVLGYASIAGGELVRESARKPFVLGNPSGGHLYVNGLGPEETAAARRDGLLAHARWVKPGPPSEAGAEMFRVACSGCHTVQGYRGIRAKVDGRSVAAIEQMVRTLDQRGRMPPFPGTDADAKVLARWLAGLDGVVEPESGAAPGDVAALGEKVMTDFCLSCHTLDGKANPLRPKLDRARFGTEAEAYRSIGRLQELNANMILEFSGTDEERHALARHLASLATGVRP